MRVGRGASFHTGRHSNVAYASNLLPNGTGILGQGGHALYLCFDPPLIDGERWSGGPSGVTCDLRYGSSSSVCAGEPGTVR